QRHARVRLTGAEADRWFQRQRAEIDAIAVGAETVLVDDPQLTARDVETARQPRRLAFGHGETELELREGTLDDELRALAGEGVQSLLLEGGPTLAESFLRAGLVDKLMLFVAPHVAGEGVLFAPRLDEPLRLTRTTVERLGEDVLLTAYVHEP
ncbi:MAG: RibD family protein, partial [Gaiellaceae bacterium]